MTRPVLSPGLAAEILEKAPRRLLKKLEERPGVASSWSWEASEEGGWRVRTDGGEIVTLRPDGGALREMARIACTCLLTPRCFHVLAVARSLAIESEDEPAAGAAETANAPAGTPRPEGTVELTLAQREAARQLDRTAAEFLAAGATAAGPLLEAELLRSVHSARAAGLHRAARAGLRVVQDARDLAERKPESSVAVLSADLADLMETSIVLAAREAQGATREWIGMARRAYEPAGNLRLHGLFCEAVVARHGMAGVVTYLCDGDRRFWTLANVAPGSPGRAREAYGEPASIGDARLPHRRLCREGLFVSDATGSADGRLGAGSGVRAVSAGPSSWTGEPADRLWGDPLEKQIDRVERAMEIPFPDRPAGADLLFLEGGIAGADEEAVLLSVSVPAGHPPIAVRLVAPAAHESLAHVENLRVLARSRGLDLRVVCRPRPERPRTVGLLAFGPTHQDGPALRLPSDWGGRVNAGLDTITGSFVAAGPEPCTAGVGVTPEPESGSPTIDPLVALRRRHERMALGGRASLPSGARSEVEGEAKLLERRLLPVAAGVLRELADSSLRADRTAAGMRGRVDPAELSQRWVAAAVYLRAASAALRRGMWLV